MTATTLCVSAGRRSGRAVGDAVATVLASLRGLVPRRALRFVHRRLPAPVRTRLALLIRALRRYARVRVSVIVAAYNSDQKGLERLVRSLDAQSLPRRHFEVIFVDDGSTDDTLQRLRQFARTRPHFVVHSIPNTGWSSGPRNVAIGMARGEYLLFMDHDDELFPRALERASAFGRRHGADVVNPKEVRTTGWSWGWDAFIEDVARADWHDPNPLIPMTPHKLYRRKFLLQHGIFFPEGRRVLWEDNYFNVQAYARGARVAVLSKYPIYRWVINGANNSGTFSRSADEYWSKLTALFDFFERELAGKPGEVSILRHYLRLRVLAFVGPRSLSRSDDYYDTAFRYVHALVERFAERCGVATMPAVDRARVDLVRRKEVKLLRLLAEYDKPVTAVATVDSLEWDGPELVIKCSATLVGPHGGPLPLRRDGDRWFRKLPGPLEGALPSETLDVTEELAASTLQVSVKGRSSKSTWQIPTQSVVNIVSDDAGSGQLQVSAAARFDPVAFAESHDLSEPVWDFAARFDGIGYLAHRGLRGGSPNVALTRGISAISYRNQDGILSLDVSNSVRSVTGSAKPQPEDVHVTTRSSDRGVEVDVVVALPLVYVHGETRQEGQVLLGAQSTTSAFLIGNSGKARLEFHAHLDSGDYELRTRFNGRTGETGLMLRVDSSSVHIQSAEEGPLPVVGPLGSDVAAVA
jgi:glycosyltransferase involved in cell wall biosynthesis